MMYITNAYGKKRKKDIQNMEEKLVVILAITIEREREREKEKYLKLFLGDS